MTEHPPSLLEPVDEDAGGPADPLAEGQPPNTSFDASEERCIALPVEVDSNSSALQEAPAVAPYARRQYPAWAGLALCGGIAFLSGAVSTQIHHYGLTVGTLTVALLAGVLLGNVLPAPTDRFSIGINFSKKNLLRLGIVLYGFRLTLSDFRSAGIAVLVIDTVMVVTTFLLAMWVGVRLLKLDYSTSALVGSGSAICGASAILATAPIIDAKPQQISIAVSTVAVFGTIALLIYPLLYRANLQAAWITGGDHAFGVFIGSTVHEVGQVIAISNASAMNTSDSAIIAKMVRVAMLLPFLVGVAAWQHRVSSAGSRSWRESFPLYPLLFALAVMVNSLAPVHDARPLLMTLDDFALAAAMAALGMSTRVNALREAGPLPLVLAGILFAWLIVGGFALNVAIPPLFAHY